MCILSKRQINAFGGEAWTSGFDSLLLRWQRRTQTAPPLSQAAGSH